MSKNQKRFSILLTLGEIRKSSRRKNLCLDKKNFYIINENFHNLACAMELLESLGNATATSIKTCSSTTAFLLEDKGDHKLYFLKHSSTL